MIVVQLRLLVVRNTRNFPAND